MSFLNCQSDSPEFLINYLKYKRYISFGAETTVNEAYYDLKTLFKYLKIKLQDKDAIYKITPDEFKEISIGDMTLSDLKKVTHQDLSDYLGFLRNTLDNSPKTRNRKLASLKRFFEYLYDNNYIDYNPSTALHCASIGKRIPKYLTLDESKQLLSSTINSDERNRIRNYAITCLFLNCSLRLSEIVGINLEDIKIYESEQTIIIRGKGNKERLLYLNAAACEAIKEYLEVRPKLGKDNVDHNALFLSERNKRISKRMVQTIIKNEMENILDESNKNKCHAHILRHTGTSLLYNENDIDIFILKIMLGHTSIKSTEVYTHISDKKLKYIMENCTISSILEKKEAKLDE